MPASARPARDWGPDRPIGCLAGFAIFLLPIPCALLAFRSGTSGTAKIVSGVWALVVAVSIAVSPTLAKRAMARGIREGCESKSSAAAFCGCVADETVRRFSVDELMEHRDDDEKALARVLAPVIATCAKKSPEFSSAVQDRCAQERSFEEATAEVCACAAARFTAELTESALTTVFASMASEKPSFLPPIPDGDIAACYVSTGALARKIDRESAPLADDDPKRPQCVKDRLATEYPGDKLASLGPAGVSTALKNAADACEARSDAVRAAVTSTCAHEGRWSSVCECASASFVERIDPARILQVKKDGWSSEVLAELHADIAACEAKLPPHKKASAPRRTKPPRRR